MNQNRKILGEIFPLLPYDTDGIIFVGYRGSIAHGTYRPNTHLNSIDDKDIIIAVVPELEYYFGLKNFGSRGTIETKSGEWDIVTYEIRKLVRMLAQGNPNVLNYLWLDNDSILYQNRAWQILVRNQHLFATKKAFNAFAGYARSQFKRMESFNKQGYMGKKRAALMEQYGYDTKNASHLIRLLRMGIEFLDTGAMRVKRSDADELLAIKDGEWSLERVKAEAAELFDRLERAADLSALPDRPNMDVISAICEEVVVEAL